MKLYQLKRYQNGYLISTHYIIAHRAITAIETFLVEMGLEFEEVLTDDIEEVPESMYSSIELYDHTNNRIYIKSLLKTEKYSQVL